MMIVPRDCSSQATETSEIDIADIELQQVSPAIALETLPNVYLLMIQIDLFIFQPTQSACLLQLKLSSIIIPKNVVGDTTNVVGVLRHLKRF